MNDPTTENNGNGDLMAGEYVLGVLNAERHAEAQARIARDRAFAAQVAAWEDRLTPLTEDVAPVAVPSHVWRRIEVALFGPEPQKRGLWDSLPFWRWLGAGASATAAALVAVVLTMSPPQTAPSLVAALQASSSDPSYVVKVDGASGNLVIRPGSGKPGCKPGARTLADPGGRCAALARPDPRGGGDHDRDSSRPRLTRRPRCIARDQPGTPGRLADRAADGSGDRRRKAAKDLT